MKKQFPQNIIQMIIFVGVLFLAFGAKAETGSFSILTYNVAGLPEIISSADSDRQSATEQISCYVNAFDIVNVQEDFNYHAALYDTCNNHPYRSPTSGGALIGSGLNTMSRFFYTDWERVGWQDCNGVDCLTPKGFTLARTRLSEGIYVDIYNLHTQAQVGDADLSARRKNILQLVNFIETHSAGNAVIVMGDTNTRYTRDGDNMWEFLNRGFTDAWIALERDGDVPEQGAKALVCDPKITHPNCEIVDKVLYRGNGFIQLQATHYEVRQDDENQEGQKLSDHPPVHVDFTYTTRDDRKLSDTFGGPHGIAFNDVSLLPETLSVRSASLRTGERVDQIMLTLDNGYRLLHGGDGGTESTLTLNSGEYLSSLRVCAGKKDGHTRIFYAQFTTNQSRTLSGGSETSDCTTFNAPTGWQIAGFHGRADNELDKVGVVYTPFLPGFSLKEASYAQIVNNASSLCLDIYEIQMANGTNVLQWHCNGGDWQKWSYDAASGLIRSQRDPHFCLNSIALENGANVTIQACRGGAHQRFTMNNDGSIQLLTFPNMVIDGYGTSVGDNVGVWQNWGGDNQRWTLVLVD